MSEREPTLRDVLGAVNELRGEMGEVRIGLGDVRGRLDRVDGRLDGLTGEVAEQGRRLDALTGKVTEQGHRLDRVDGRLDGLTGEVKTLGRETRELRTELPAQVVAGVLVGFERSAYATDLRTLPGGGSRVESRRGRVEASFGRVARKTWTNTPERASCRGYQIADSKTGPHHDLAWPERQGWSPPTCAPARLPITRKRSTAWGQYPDSTAEWRAPSA